jgi:histidinol dehydrogenase
MELKTIRIDSNLDSVRAYLKRNTGRNSAVEQQVTEIINAVRERGDQALFEYTLAFDGVDLTKTGLAVSAAEVDAAYNQVSEEFIVALRAAKERIEQFHCRQIKQSWLMTEDNGSILGQLLRPLERVGLYAPGGRAVYPSSVLMTAIPAKLAGVKELTLCTPPDRTGRVDPQLLVAARETGVTKIYRCGGAQAMAALAFGTETIEAVDKIAGPGNIYVATAKKQLYGQVDIDSIAGPSEVVIIADESARPDWVAADLIAQAEHDPEAVSILITNDEGFLPAVFDCIDQQLQGFSRKEIAEQSLQEQGIVFLVRDLDQGAEVSNLIAPEHLQLMVHNSWGLLTKINNAGAVFLGGYSPVALGDYSAGTNHVLPTNGTARFFSALSVDHFVKRINLAAVSSGGIKAFGNSTIQLARGEGLPGHARAVEIRLSDLEKEGDQID